ncbi:MAG: sulfotransferase [Alphaproteobacteria bacterium]|nr:sulfotransferase [Alphaproteobacteria bacterium]
MSISVLKSIRSPETIPHINRVLAGCLSAPSDADLSSLQALTLLIGGQWSGSTLISAMLDAHPEIVMANEFNLLRQFKNGLSLKQAARLMLFNARMFTKNGTRWTGYAYAIPGQFQGRYRTLKIIGDKKAQSSAQQLYANIDLIARMQDKYNLPVRMIHAVRNPYDTLAMMAQRQGMPLDQAIETFEKICEGAAFAYRKYPAQVLLVRHEDLRKEPKHTVRRLIAFLETECPDDYVAACAAAVDREPKKPRHDVSWTQEQRRQVEDMIDRHEFLNGYAFDEP